MIGTKKRIVWVIYLTLCSLMICCNKPSQSDTPPEIVKPSAAVEMPGTQPSETEEEQEGEPDPQEVPIAEDFAQEAEAMVNDDNYLAELERLEKEIERE